MNARLPLQNHYTIGDRLNAAPGGAVSWAWFSGGWDNAKMGVADFLFQFHHQPFAFFAKYALASVRPGVRTARRIFPFLDTRAYGEGQTLTVGSLAYSTVVFTALLGMAFWGEVPSTGKWMAILTIVVSGVIATLATPRTAAAQGSALPVTSP